MSVKSNEEYRALNAEVAHERERIAELEEQILTDMELADELTAETARADSALSEAAAELQRESERIDVAQVELGREREALAERLTEQSKSLPPKLVGLFSKGRLAKQMDALCHSPGRIAPEDRVQLSDALRGLAERCQELAARFGASSSSASAQA